MSIVKIIKKIGRFVLFFIGSIIALMALFILLIRINSNGQQELITDTKGNILPNSIAFHEDKIINGVPQRLTIRGADINNPVLLRVHGGPGGSFIPFFSRTFNVDLEDLFVVCYWDQRGSGPAYSFETPDSTITLPQIVDDGIAVSTYLNERFKKEKIYIEGISWGTTVSAFMAQKRPDLFHAFIGIGQMANQPLSEQQAYDFFMEKASEANDTVSVRKLKAIGRPPYATNEEMIKAVQVEREIDRMYTQIPQSVNSENEIEVLVKFLLDKGNSFEFKRKLVFGSKQNEPPGFKLLWPTCATVNLMRDVPEWQIPVYILQGENDHATEFSVARMYFDSLQAPEKKWFPFKNSGHGANFEYPELYRTIMKTDVLKKDN